MRVLAHFRTMHDSLIGLQVGSSKKKMAPPPAPEAGPSKPKQPETKPEVKQETKEKSGAAAPEKPKGSGKLSNFFGGAAKPKESKEVRKIKQEEPAPEPAKRMFFSKPTAPKAASDAPQKQKTDAPQKVDVLQKADAPQRVPSSKTKTSTSKVPSRAPSVSSTKEEKAPEKETEKSTVSSPPNHNSIAYSFLNRGVLKESHQLDWKRGTNLHREMQMFQKPKVVRASEERLYCQMTKKRSYPRNPPLANQGVVTEPTAWKILMLSTMS